MQWVSERSCEDIAQGVEGNGQFDVEIACRPRESAEPQLNRCPAFDAIIADDPVVDGVLERGDKDRAIKLVPVAGYRDTGRTRTPRNRGFKATCSNARTGLSH
jgi:hypothetical protein